MTKSEILAAIAADPVLQELAAERDDAAIAAELSVGRTRIEPTLRATVSPVKWAWLLLERGELDVGLASVRGQIDALVPDVMTADQAQVLKDLAMRPDPIPLNLISEALNV